MSTASTTPTPILPRNKPDLRQAMLLFAREILASLSCGQSGTIQTFYPDLQTADVAFNASLVVGYQTDGSGNVKPVTKDYPLLPSVPVIFLGGGGAALTFPVKQGDTCLLVFLDRDQDDWIQGGQTGLPPHTNRLHSLSDAVAIVGLRCLQDALEGFSATDTQLYGPSGPSGPLVSLDDEKMGLGNASGQLVDAINALATALTSWVDTNGDTPNPATIAAINAAKAAWIAILK